MSDFDLEKTVALPARGTRLALSIKSKQASSVWSCRTKEHLRSWKIICGTSACTFAFSPSLHSHSYSRTCDHVLLVLVSSVVRAQVAGGFLCWVPFRYLHFFSRFRSVVPLRLRALVNLRLPPTSMSFVLFVSLSRRRAPAVIFFVSLSQVLSTSTSDLNWFLLKQHHGLPSPHTSIDHTSSPSFHHVHNLVTFDIDSSRFQLSVSLGPLQLLLSHIDSQSSGIMLATFLHLLAAGHSSISIFSLAPESSFYNVLHVRTSLKLTT